VIQVDNTKATVASWVLTVFLSLLAGCDITPPAQENASPEIPLLSVHDTMTWILEPAAEVIWDSAGFIITAEGEQDLTPTTEEGWQAVLYAAATLSESGHLLALPGRSAGEDWNEYAAGLSTAARLAMDAAHTRDSEALFKAGGRIYQVCRACHNQYWVRSQDN